METLGKCGDSSFEGIELDSWVVWIDSGVSGNFLCWGGGETFLEGLGVTSFSSSDFSSLETSLMDSFLAALALARVLFLDNVDDDAVGMESAGLLKLWAMRVEGEIDDVTVSQHASPYALGVKPVTDRNTL